MSVMTTVLTEFSTNGNSRTSTLAGHTTTSPRLVIEKRRVPEGAQTMVESSVKVVYATRDVNGAPVPNKISFEGIMRYPLTGDMDDVSAAKAIFADIINGDEYANTVSTQEWLN